MTTTPMGSMNEVAAALEEALSQLERVHHIGTGLTPEELCDAYEAIEALIYRNGCTIHPVTFRVVPWDEAYEDVD